MTENEEKNEKPQDEFDEKPGLAYILLKYFYRYSLKILFRLEAHGIENVPQKGGLLLISNHASNLDPPALGVYLPRTMHTMAKEELFKYPVVRTIMTKMKGIPIRRGAVDRKAMRECAKWLKLGSVVLLFPEGTRTPDGELQEGKAGAAMLALGAGVPCLPAYIQGSYDAWPRHKKLPRYKKVHIHYGKPFDLPERPEDMKSKEYYQLCADEMMKKIAEIKEQVEG